MTTEVSFGGMRSASVSPEDLACASKNTGPCHCDAHAELPAYGDTGQALDGDVLPLAAEAETVMGMLHILLGMSAELQARHPDAFRADSSSMTGYTNEPACIPRALPTCELKSEPTGDEALVPPALAPTA